jgi:hypothetical protein
MKKLIKNNLSIFIRLIILIVLIGFIITFTLLQTNTDFAEWWTRNISRFYQFIVGISVKHLSFSVTEIFFLLLVIGTVILLVTLIFDFVKKRINAGISKITTISLIYLSLVFVYIASTSLAYYRAPLAIDLYEEKVDKSEFYNIIKYYLDDFNKCSENLSYDDNGALIMPYSSDKLNENLEKEYEKLTNPYFSSFTTYCKPMLSSFLYVEFQITGVTFGVLGEANYDVYMTSAEYPFTFAHEMAHAKGVMRENDAQMVAAYICLNSEDYFIRYSGYIYTFNSLMNLARYTGNKGDYSELYNQINHNILNNYKQISDYWDKHDFLSDFAEFWNNLYLNIFGSDTTDSYQDPPAVVDPDTQEITKFSNYQKLYFEQYFSKNK